MIDSETFEIISRQGYEYQGPLHLCKESQQQKDAQAAQTAYTQQLQQIMTEQFAQQQDLLSFLKPQLEAMAANPQGFGATELANLQSSLVSNIGAQTQNLQKELNQNFAVSNEAGLPSGVQEMAKAQLLQGQAATEAQGLSNIQLANEQLKQQQQQYGLGALSGPVAEFTLGSPQSARLAGTALNSQFAQATQVYNQGSLLSNIFGGLAGGVTGALTGGLSTAIGNVFNKAAAPQKSAAGSYTGGI